MQAPVLPERPSEEPPGADMANEILSLSNRLNCRGLGLGTELDLAALGDRRSLKPTTKTKPPVPVALKMDSVYLELGSLQTRTFKSVMTNVWCCLLFIVLIFKTSMNNSQLDNSGVRVTVLIHTNAFIIDLWISTYLQYVWRFTALFWCSEGVSPPSVCSEAGAVGFSVGSYAHCFGKCLQMTFGATQIKIKEWNWIVLREIWLFSHLGNDSA